MSNLVKELNSLDLGFYFSAPLQAAVQAQNASSLQTVEFIEDIGFEEDNNGNTVLKVAQFEYEKSFLNPHYQKTAAQLQAEGLPPSTNTADQFLTEDVTIKAPLLAMINIPSLMVEEVDIRFNAKLTSTETGSFQTVNKASFEAGLKLKKFNMKIKASHQKTTNGGTKVEKTYDLNIRMIARNGETPEGLQKLLDILSDSFAAS